MPSARATGMGSTLPVADHENRLCLRHSSTISLESMAARYHVAMTDEGATSDLASTMPGDPHALSRTAAAAGPPVQAGDQLPVELPAAERYREPELLGRGGMDIVQRFQDAVIGREVAMKVSVGASD